MSEDITITHIDQHETKESIGEKKKVELVHDKLFREYNIDPKNTFDGSVLKQIPGEWIPKIIEDNIQITSPNFAITEAQHATGNKVFILIFDNEIAARKFSTNFNKNMFQSINKYIESQKVNPKHYHRNIVFTESINENKITLSY